MRELREIREALYRLERHLNGLAKGLGEMAEDEATTLARIAALSTAFDNETKTVGDIAAETKTIRDELAAAQTAGTVPQSITDALTALGTKDAAIAAALAAEAAADAPPAATAPSA